MKKYDLLVYIGRFQPLHLGHQTVIENALSLSEKVLVLIGSSQQARCTRNPFTYEERKKLITDLYPQIIIEPLHDHTYDDNAWIEEVQDKVKTILLKTKEWNPNGLADYKIGLIGCNKDATTYYLKMFPNWSFENVEQFDSMSATPIRERMLSNRLFLPYIEEVTLHPSIYNFILKFMKTEEYKKLHGEYSYLVNYNKQYGKGPFLTADALIQVQNKILLVRRGKEFGQGLLAMPGGFLEEGETFFDAMIRELQEETNFPIDVIKNSVTNSFVADYPNRSARGRIISKVFHIKLEELYEIFAGDDADEAFWIDINSLKQEDFFEDHYHIIKKVLNG